MGRRTFSREYKLEAVRLKKQSLDRTKRARHPTSSNTPQ